MSVPTTAPSAEAAAFGALSTSAHLSPEQIDGRARELLAQLTLDEKLGLMDADTPFWGGLADMFNGGCNAHVWPAG